MQRRITIVFCALALVLVAQQAAGLVPEPRVDDSQKFSMNNSIKQDKGDYKKSYQSETYNSTPTDKPEARMNVTSNDDMLPIGDESVDDLMTKPRFVLGEPYKSMTETMVRFALAQSSVPNYVQIDTVMDLISDTGYMLTSPHLLNKALSVTTIAMTILMTVFMLLPPIQWKWLGVSWRQTRGRLLAIEKYLPNGINEMGIIHMLEEKTEEWLARVELTDGACRRQSVCQLGELLRCTFPKFSKSVVRFISENFSRPRYRDHVYVGSFLQGFVDRNCAANIEMDQSRTCFSSMLKSLSSCPRPIGPPPQPATAPTTTTTTSKPKSEQFQTLYAGRA